MNYSRLAMQIHSQNRKVGFWESERDLGEMLMLAISELAEALEEHRDGKPDLYFLHSSVCARSKQQSPTSECEYCNPKPEGLAIEIADCMIRLLDTLEHYVGGELNQWVVVERTKMEGEELELNTGSVLLQIATAICKGKTRDGNVREEHLIRALLWCEKYLEYLGKIPLEVMACKMDYNTTRPYKHGKAY